MKTETLSWSGETTVTVKGFEYLCDFDCAVEIQQWLERHEPGFSEPMGDAIVTLESFEALNPGGQQVIERGLLREIRAELVQWVGNNEEKIIKGAK